MPCAMTNEQRYLFDNAGYIVIPDVLTSDQVDQLRATLRESTEQFPPVPQTEGPVAWGLEQRIGVFPLRQRRVL